MIGNSDILVISFLRRIRHLLNGAGPVAPDRVHLEIAAKRSGPIRLFCQDGL